MLKGLGGATIWSEDLNILLPFYRDVLGLKVAFESPEFVGFGERAALNLGFQLGGIVGHKFLAPFRVTMDMERSELLLERF